MKKFICKTLVLMSVIVGFVACSDDDDLNKPGVDIEGITDDLSVEAIAPIDSVDWREHYEDMIQEYSSSNDEEDQEIADSLRAEMDIFQSYVDSIYQEAGINASDGSGSNIIIGYKYTTISYNSIDDNNQPIKLSALVVWPYNAVFERILPKKWGVPDADGVVMGCHITITKNFDSPSNYKNRKLTNDVGMMACAAKSRGATGGWGAAFENLVVIPDYQGYGITGDRNHPYLQQDLTARQVVDGVRAGIKYYKEKLKRKFEDDWHSISLGYSQGGSVALAVHRYIEMNNLTKELKFRGSLCGDGPYSPMATVKRYIKDNKVFMPVAMGLIIKGMLDCNPYIKGKYTAADFCTQKFLDTGIFDVISQKNKSTKSIQNHFYNHSGKYDVSEDKFVMYRHSPHILSFGGGYQRYTKDNMKDQNGKDRKWEDKGYAEIDQILRPEIIKWLKGEEVESEYKEKMEDFKKAMDMNDLSNKDYGWTPKKPIVLLHSVNDEVVPVENLVAIYDSFYFNTSSILRLHGYVGDALSDHIGFGKPYYLSFTDYLSAELIKNRFKKSAILSHPFMTPYHAYSQDSLFVSTSDLN